MAAEPLVPERLKELVALEHGERDAELRLVDPDVLGLILRPRHDPAAPPLYYLRTSRLDGEDRPVLGWSDRLAYDDLDPRLRRQ